MFQGIPKSIWPATYLLAVVVGIVPGIIMAQPHWIFLAELLGWLVLPKELYALITHSYTAASFWYTLLAPLSLVFAMLAYGGCAAWVIYRTGLPRKGLVVAGVAVCVSTLVSVSVAAVTLILIDGGNVFYSFPTYFSGTLMLSGFIGAQLAISAVLGWLISAGLARLHRRETLVASR